MSKTLQQIFTINPITTNSATDLMYFSQSPYTPGLDAGMTFANFAAQFGAPYTPAALSKTDDTNVTLSLGGSPTTALLHATSLTLGWTGQLAVPRGGTGDSSFTAYSVVCGGTTSTGALQNVSGVGTSNQVLVSQGPAALPIWSSVPGLTPAALTKSDDTNVTVTLGGTPATSLLQATSLTMGWTGTLAVGRGGLGISTTPTNGQIPIGNGTNYTASVITPGTGISVTNGSGSITLATASAVATSFITDSGTATPSAGALTVTGSSTGLTTTGSGSTVGMTGTLVAGHGGTGLSSLTTYGLLAGGTTSTGNLQQVGTGTTGQMLQSGGSSALPSFTTATYPGTAGSAGTILRSNGTNWVASTATFADTYGASTILYSNGANTVQGLATANNSILVTSGSGVPSLSTTLPAFTTSTITFNPTTDGLVGTTTNDSASSGIVGELIFSQVTYASSISLSTNAGANVTSIVLTAGDWDVFGNVFFAASVAISSAYAAFSTTSATLPDNSLISGFTYPTMATGVTVPGVTIQLSGNLTVYLVAIAAFGSGTAIASGNIFARRRR